MQNANNEAKRLIRIQAGLSDLNALDSASFSCSLFFFREIQQTNKQNPQTFATLETSCTKPYRPRVSGRRRAEPAGDRQNDGCRQQQRSETEAKVREGYGLSILRGGSAAGRGRHRRLGLCSWFLSNRSFSPAASYFHRTKLSEGNLRVNGWGCTGPVLERSRRSGPAPQRPRRARGRLRGPPCPSQPTPLPSSQL